MEIFSQNPRAGKALYESLSRLYVLPPIEAVIAHDATALGKYDDAETFFHPTTSGGVLIGSYWLIRVYPSGNVLFRADVVSRQDALRFIKSLLPCDESERIAIAGRFFSGYLKEFE